MSVAIETTLGHFIIDLYIDSRPRTTRNFIKLCKTGDPTGSGRGGESIFAKLYGEQAKYFEAESKPLLKHQKCGTISMVNNGNGMHGSQFFVTLAEDIDYLDGIHTVFGEITEGHEILQKLNNAVCDDEHRPYQDILITHTVILDDPFEDPPGLQVPPRSPELTMEQLKHSRIAPGEEIDDTKGKSMEEIEEEIKSKEAKASAAILEMVGDIPDAEVAPPDCVLFVCKLNPVTTAEDLEVIFSRFGRINSCEVIKDQKTGESLQYAFIEFDKPEDCESAYFKMDNVLIDDRRIHVDFSQSVSKLKGKPWQQQNDSKKGPLQNLALKVPKKDGRKKYDLIFEDGDKARAEENIPSLKKGNLSYEKEKLLKGKQRGRSSSSDSENEMQKLYKKTKRKKKASGSSSSSENEKESKNKKSPKVKKEVSDDEKGPTEKARHSSSSSSSSKDSKKAKKKKRSSSSSSASDGHRSRDHSKDKKKRSSSSGSSRSSARSLPKSYERDVRKRSRDRKRDSSYSDSGSDTNRRRYDRDRRGYQGGNYQPGRYWGGYNRGYYRGRGFRRDDRYYPRRYSPDRYRRYDNRQGRYNSGQRYDYDRRRYDNYNRSSRYRRSRSSSADSRRSSRRRHSSSAERDYRKRRHASSSSRSRSKSRSASPQKGQVAVAVDEQKANSPS